LIKPSDVVKSFYGLPLVIKEKLTNQFSVASFFISLLWRRKEEERLKRKIFDDEVRDESKALADLTSFLLNTFCCF